ncbi:membrane protein [Terrihabitans soli]|uniref:Membrane protein n=1 Tax=Terrihabitans soli TaxID=708113 RepID=A0A6S6QU42_9HYPH|nr:NosD domain-containing protein [Terrihabitans soli]BCJ90591.1 membrane protein [Terrihabitans soli]
MKRIILSLIMIFGFFAIAGSPASAQATRTWVSGVGDDVNPCSRTAPCKTFAGAISKTAAGGIINCIDPGGFGAVTITKSITIDCKEGGGILAAATNGIIVNAAGIVVSLRNLVIEGANTGLNGVRIINAAAVHLDNVTITQFKAGTASCVRVETPAGATTELTMTNSKITDSGIAPTAGGGVVLQPAAGGNVRFAIDQVTILNTTNGIFVNSPASGSVRGTVSNSLIFGNDNAGLVAQTAGAATRIMIDQTVIVGNLFGLFASGGAGVVVGDSTITANTTGMQVTGGTIQSFGTNRLIDNTTNGAFTPPAVSQN